MAWHERDYYRDGPSSFGGGGGPFSGGGNPFGGGKGGAWSITLWLIVINVAVFVIDAILGRIFGAPPLSLVGYFSADTAILQLQLWRFVTFQFLHGGIFHILINMLILYMFGRFVEQYLGSRRYLAFYLLCGVAGALGYMLLWSVGLIVSGPQVPLVGASAGVFGVVIGTAVVAPDVRVLFMFVIPMQIRTVAWIALGIAAFTVLAYGDQQGANAGGQAAHLGGAALGFLLIKNAHWLDWADNLPLPGGSAARGGGSPGSFSGSGGFGSFGSSKGSGASGGSAQPKTDKFKQKVAEVQANREKREDQEVDRILDKVKQQGLQSLTKHEKKVLGRATERQNQTK